MHKQLSIVPNGCLAFELNVLRRLKYQSALIPFTDEPHIGAYLKRWDVLVFANDLMQSAWTKAIATIENNTEAMSEKAVQMVLEDAYVPHYRLQNPSLRNWFNETDAWWFDNVRQNINKLSSPIAKAIALSIGMKVGDYVLSFSDETLQLRQPLSKVFKNLWNTFPKPINNKKENLCRNQVAREFIAENGSELMFLRLPVVHNQPQREHLGWKGWREEWIRGTDEFWGELENEQSGKLDAPVETKAQYLQFLEDILQTASHIPQWAISHAEDGFISTQDIVEVIGKIRRVDTVFTKDFSELIGLKAVVITA
jgi:hypothetical protein